MGDFGKMLLTAFQNAPRPVKWALVVIAGLFALEIAAQGAIVLTRELMTFKGTIERQNAENHAKSKPLFLNVQ